MAKTKKKVSREIVPEKVDDVIDFLARKAFGYTVVETVNEYNTLEDGSLRLIKQKKSEKSMPPDVALIKLYCDLTAKTDDDYEFLTDEELNLEKQRLLSELMEENRESRTK